MYRETIFKGRDNAISLAIEQGEAVLSAGQVTRAHLVLKRQGQADITVDSTTDAAVFGFAGTEVVQGRLTRLLDIKLGLKAAALPIPDGLYQIDVYLYDTTNTNGLYWDTIAAQIRAGG